MDISLLVRYLFLLLCCWQKGRLKNKDIAFYASLNSDFKSLEMQKEEKQQKYQFRPLPLS